jgi:uncharacterized protein
LNYRKNKNNNITHSGDWMNIEDKIGIVEDILKDKKVAIGFSGGADSTLLAYLSSEVAEDTLAITIDNHLLPTGFVENTERTCKDLSIRHEIIDIDFYENEDFLANDSRRCFNCRRLMYSTIRKIAEENGFDYICDGNNISDLVLDRPGILVTYAERFETPFIEARLTSSEIHEFLNRKGIPYSRSTTCLATRIPTDTKTTKEKILKIRHCEDYISGNTACEIVKVRDFGKLGIVEVDKIDEILSEDKFKRINDALKAYGFEKVCLNLSQIDDNDDIIIDYGEGCYSYQLPFTINLEDTEKQMENVISYDEEKIELDKSIIFEDGLIEGHDFENYEDARDAFMDILTKIRRDI